MCYLIMNLAFPDDFPFSETYGFNITELRLPRRPKQMVMTLTIGAFTCPLSRQEKGLRLLVGVA